VEAKLLRIFENLPSPVIFLDADCHIDSINPAAQHLLQVIASFPDPEMPEVVQLPAWLTKEIQQLILAGDDEVVFERRIMLPDGPSYFQVTLRRLHEEKAAQAGMLIIISDLSELRLVEDGLREMVQGVTEATGDDFFQFLVLHLAKSVDADYAFIGEFCDEARTMIRTVAVCAEGHIVPSLTFSLAGTPCAEVIRQGCCYSSDDVVNEFPLDHLAMKLEVRHYVGLPLISASGMVLGPMAVFSRRPLRDQQLASSILQVFATRAAAELERKHAEEALKTSEERYRLLVEYQSDLVIKLDKSGQFLFVSPSFCAVAGRDETMLLGTHYAPFVLPEDRAEVARSFKSLLRPPHTSYHENRAYTGAGVRWFGWAMRTVVDEQGEISAFVGIGRDISERKEAEAEIQKLAYFDRLTGLPNRQLLHDRIQQALIQSRRDGRRVAVMFLDLDRFKEINDTLGHDIGDQLLQAVAERLNTQLRGTDTVARLGGDEFVVVLPAVSQEEDVAAIAQKILEALSEQFPFSGHNLFTSASIGIALAPADGDDVATLIKHADMAMYKAKDQGRNAFRFFSAEMNVKAMERMILESGLRRALERNEFFLCYQPQLDLASNTLVGMEALLRWQHPDLGLLGPNSFIPIAEETGLIVPIGEWVLRTACLQNKAWQDAGFPCLKVAVNLSARQFRQQNLLQVVLQALQDSGLGPQWLELELTESTIMTNPDEALEVLRQLKKVGVTLAIDDFGTGYSSLSYLKIFPIDSLKIDRTFIRELTTNRNDAAIAEAIISMAHKLELKVIAEGVELEAQQGFLTDSRCNMLQGYYFSYPLTVEEFSAFLSKQLPGASSPEITAAEPAPI